MLYFETSPPPQKNRKNVENTENFALIGMWQPCLFHVVRQSYIQVLYSTHFHRSDL